MDKSFEKVVSELRINENMDLPDIIPEGDVTRISDSLINNAHLLKNIKVLNPDGKTLDIEKTRIERERFITERIKSSARYFPKGFGITKDDFGLPIYGRLEM